MGEREIRGYPTGIDLSKGNIKWKNLRLYRDHALSIFVVHGKGFINAWMNRYSGHKCVLYLASCLKIVFNLSHVILLNCFWELKS